MVHRESENCQPAPHPDGQPGTTPSAFRALYPECGTVVVFPFDPVRSAILDQLLYLEERLQSLTCAEVEVVL